MLAEVPAHRVSILYSYRSSCPLTKAKAIGLAGRVYTIDLFLEKATAENPALTDYKVLTAKKVLIGNVNLSDPFFDSFRLDYPGFDKWLNRKADEQAYVCTSESGDIFAFLS